MNVPVIQVQNLSKRYVIGHQPTGDGLRHSIENAIRSPRRWLRERLNRSSSTREEFWALRDVSFSISQGEVVGFVGRNGAGKSTLLKLLSRISEPTRGRIELNGRVASLLEVGTGFHPELTGRENIFLNGAVLGMRRAEIKRKFDEIVEFSGVERFLDTPVKRYSSGMYVRLAFSVAAHLEPEILIVDEVLAVGDAEFQKKCLGRMNDVARDGRTVLFVTHNVATVQALCTRAIYLRSGELITDGPVPEVLAAYSSSVRQMIEGVPLAERADRTGGELLRITAVDFIDTQSGEPLAMVLSGQDITIRMHFTCRLGEPLDNVALAIAFFSLEGVFLFSCSSDAVGALFDIDARGGTSLCRIRKWPLSDGRYTFTIHAGRNGVPLDWVRQAGYIEVERGDYYGTGKNPEVGRKGVLIDYEWHALLQPSLSIQPNP